MTERLESLRVMALAALAQAESAPALQEVKARYLGRKGHLIFDRDILRDKPE